jgi:uncharacterized cupredoxin-like copper-binding protein
MARIEKNTSFNLLHDQEIPMHKRAAAIAVSAVALIAAHKAHAHGAETHGGEKHRKPNLDMAEKKFGRTGNPKKVARTIRIDGTDDMRYTPAKITVKQGETIRFIVANRGKLMHETVLGTLPELNEHAAWMKKYPNMEHDEPFMTHVGPGQTGEMIWEFTQPGVFHFGCLIPGHFEAGMRGTIEVVAAH